MEPRKPAEVKWYVTKSQYSPLPYREKLTKAGLDFFLPTRYTLQDIAGRRLRVERPVIFNFIFVRGTVFAIKDFCLHNPGLHLLYRHRFIDDKENTEEKLLMTVSDKEMRMFAMTVGEYTKDVPFIKPSEIDLEKGDHVRILEGNFAGVEGVLMSQQGKDGGRVLVSIGNLIAVPTLEIEPEYLQIISFAPTGKHMYKKFDSFMIKARRAIRHYFSGKIEKADVVALTTFERRFANLQTHTTNSKVKLLVYLLVCYTCLQDSEKKTETEKLLQGFLSQIQSETYKALAFTYLYACTNNEDYLSSAQEIVGSWGEISSKEKTKNEIVEDINFIISIR